jgi:hypothetical protein
MEKIKLYTEGEVRNMLENTDFFTEEGIQYFIDEMKAISLPSDDETLDRGRHSINIDGFLAGAKWVIKQIKQQADGTK